MEEAVGDGCAKRRKTEVLHRQSLLQQGASISAVARIAARLRDCPQDVSRWKLRDANDSAFEPLRRVHTLNLVGQSHVCVVWDEFMPGNVLSSSNARKTMVLSLSFLELDQDKLLHT